MEKGILRIILSILLILFILGLFNNNVYASSNDELSESLFIVKDIEKARVDIEKAGGIVRHIFPEEKVLIGLFPKKVKSEYITNEYRETILKSIKYEDLINNFPNDIPDKAKSIYSAWESNLVYKKIPIEEKLKNIPDVEPPYNDLVIVEREPDFEKKLMIPDSLPMGASPTDTSSYFIGDISVSVIFPESDESSPNTEDWTAQEILDVKSEIMNGMDWWALREPNAHLTFIYNYEERIPTIEEPILYESWWDEDWINAVMLNLGYGPEQYPVSPLIYEYINDQRNDKNTDWGFVIFVVDSSNDLDGRFSNGMFAYTVGTIYGGGPYMVMTYNNSGHKIENMDSVTAHETGHIFNALDQYGNCGCSDRDGYLYVENQNCMNDCLIDEMSIMKGTIIPFIGELVDDYARGQIGWNDSDGDGILDIV